jgi:serine/threonine-protein kinase
MALAGHDPFSRELSPGPGEDEIEVEATLTRRAIAVGPRGPRPGPGPGPRPEMTVTAVTETPTPTGGEGTLRVNTRPWSQVFVDGRLIGNTPQMNIPLPAGRHTVRLVNPDFNIQETVPVTIRSGQTETLIRRLTPG